MSNQHVYIKITVFIVEDDEGLVSFYSNILAFNNWKVIAISKNGLDALDIYRGFTNNLEVVLLDINLPGCSGIDVAKAILNMNSFQKILFVSAQVEKLDGDLILKNYPRIQKPFKMPQFLKVLNDGETSDK